MNMKVLLAGLLALCLCLTLCACGGNEPPVEETPTTTEAPTTTATTTEAPAAPTAPTPAEGQVLYTIKVVDKAGAPVEGVYVQMCTETCVFTATDSEGVAYFCVAEDEYKVAFTEAPDTYYYFEDGSREMTLTYVNAVEDNEPTEAPTEAPEEENIFNDAELEW